MNDQSYLNNINSSYIDYLYQQYKKDKSLIDIQWRIFFEGYEIGLYDKSHLNKKHDSLLCEKLINEFRIKGHHYANNNPIISNTKKIIDYYNFSDTQLSQMVFNDINYRFNNITLKNLISKLEKIYCDSLSIECNYLENEEHINWLFELMESRLDYKFNLNDIRNILYDINQSVVFENFLYNKYIGQKIFSILGAESLIPSLNYIIKENNKFKIEKFIIGMGHRGRLNVLANVLKKPYVNIFREFNKIFNNNLNGDVKYHLGYNNNNAILLPNPSHLESIYAVVQGLSRSFIDLDYNRNYTKILPIIIHGDAAISGQGIVYELAQMSLLNAYYTGGTIHVVINNQIGFTTDVKDARSSQYCTDIAKVIKAPVLHVNAEDLNAVIYAFNMSLMYRQKFHRDIYIDLICYRKYGHNEIDDPKLIHPNLYETINNHNNIYEIYKNQILNNYSHDFNNDSILAINKDIYRNINNEFNLAKDSIFKEKNDFIISNDKIYNGFTGVHNDVVRNHILSVIKLISKSNCHIKIHKIFKIKENNFLKKDIIDWTIGEILAYTTLLSENYNIRIIGQDSKRGTFAHRYGALKLYNDNEFIPINNLSTNKAQFEIYNSNLSEYAALGFEYGYSINNKNNIVIWEAQFGDFTNGAQIIIDQFISSAKSKWNQNSNIILLLPHGYEGQGPEHSSARIERFLSLCSNNNLQLVNCTTPAQYFHIIRQQSKNTIPLIIFTPKSLLRHPQCISHINDFNTNCSFKNVIDDNFNNELITKLIFCSGKIFYDLKKIKNKYQFKNISIVRIERIYPLPIKEIEKIILRCNHIDKILWVQEEPYNMGLWPYLSNYLYKYKVKFIGRPKSSSVATGYYKVHLHEQINIIANAFDIDVNQISSDIV